MATASLNPERLMFRLLPSPANGVDVAGLEVDALDPGDRRGPGGVVEHLHERA